jgi:phosphatidylglycerol:prolipoprotein diacylglycerol transferase
LFLLTYGVFRFFVEYFREPDAHIGLYADVISQGQILCIPMILAGFGMMVFAYRKADQAKASQASKGK